MNPSIKAILFDIGGTLRGNQATGGWCLESVTKLQQFIADQSDPSEFLSRLRDREAEYRRQVQKSLVELSEADLWARHMLPDYPEEFVRENAISLTRLWRESRIKYVFPDAVETVRILASRGYILGIISNTTSSVEGPEMLEKTGIAPLFSTVILSTVFGRRKPHPSLFLEASKEIGVPPGQCAYIGDRLSRDLIGARQAGYGEVVIINYGGYGAEWLVPEEDSWQDEKITAIKPDFFIGRLEELLNLFPAVNHHHPECAQPVQYYDAALSTMWGVEQGIPFGQTFELARKAGFVRFELNHQITPKLYSQWDSNHHYISTVHDPCPAVYLNEDLKKNDFMISSLKESNRIQGLDMAKRSIDLACQLGSRSVVIHPGMIMGDRSLENGLRSLYRKGLKGTEQYASLKSELIAHRAKLVPPHFAQVMKSMSEIVEYARSTGIEIGLENRYHYYDIPLPDEMQILLELCGEGWYGFQYDVGHAQALSALGLVDHMEWLERFSSRMIGTHLHDVVGLEDHQPPGCGEVDFKIIAPYLPETAHRTLEVSPRASLDDLANGLKFLAESGCIHRL